LRIVNRDFLRFVQRRFEAYRERYPDASVEEALQDAKLWASRFHREMSGRDISEEDMVKVDEKLKQVRDYAPTQKRGGLHRA